MEHAGYIRDVWLGASLTSPEFDQVGEGLRAVDQVPVDVESQVALDRQVFGPRRLTGHFVVSLLPVESSVDGPEETLQVLATGKITTAAAFYPGWMMQGVVVDVEGQGLQHLQMPTNFLRREAGVGGAGHLAPVLARHFPGNVVDGEVGEGRILVESWIPTYSMVTIYQHLIVNFLILLEPLAEGKVSISRLETTEHDGVALQGEPRYVGVLDQQIIFRI